MTIEERNKLISDARRATSIKRQSQQCKAFKFKVDWNHLTLEQKESIKMLFVEAKWTYNYILANQDNLDIYDVSKLYNQLIDITHKDRYGNNIPVTITHLGSSVRQQIIQKIANQIKGLAAAKKKGRKVGALKFKSKYRSIEFKQYGVTHYIKGNKFKLQGIKKPVKVFGLDQLSKYEDIDYANMNLVYDGINTYIVLNCFVPKENRTDYKNEEIGLDFGISTTITTSNGDKFDFKFEETEKLKKLQAKLARQVKDSNNWKRTNFKIRKEYKHISNIKDDTANKFVHMLLEDNRVVVIQDEQIDSWKHDSNGEKKDSSCEVIQHGILGRIKAILVRNERVVVLDRWLPTTKMCFNCGNKHNSIELSDRVFVCPVCGASEDRDIHAAKNMLEFYHITDKAGTVYTDQSLSSQLLAQQEDTTSSALY